MAASVAAAGFLSFALPLWWDVRPLLIHGWYYALWVHMTLMLHAAYQVYGRNGSIRSQWRSFLAPAAAGLVFAGAFFCAVDGEFRVLSDETNLLGSAYSLHLNRTYENITEGYVYYDLFHPTAMELDKRPPLFSFCVALLHDLLGVDAFHGMVFNLWVALVLGAVFFALLRAVSQKASTGVMGLLILLGLPFVGLVVRSSGFEALNMLCIVLFYGQAYVYLKEPSSEKLELLLLIALALAMCRYESILFVIPAVLAGFWGMKRIAWSTASWRMLLVPLGFVPLNWQRALTSSINPGDEPEGAPFGISYLSKNLQFFGEFLWDPRSKGFPSSPFLVTLAVFGFVFFVAAWRAGRFSTLTKQMAWIMGLGSLAIVIVQCSYYMGDIRQVYQHRLAASHAPVLALLGVYGVATLQEKWTHESWWKWGLWSLLIASSVGGLRQAQIAYQGRWLTLFREYKASLGFLLKEPRQGTLLISERPGMFTVHQYGAISFETAERKKESLASDIRRRLYRTVLVEQQVPYAHPDRPTPALKLMPGLGLEPVFELQNDAGYFVRISKIVERPDEVKTDSPPPGPSPERAREKRKKSGSRGKAPDASVRR